MQWNQRIIQGNGEGESSTLQTNAKIDKVYFEHKESNVEDTAFLKLHHINGIESRVDISFGCYKEVRKIIFYYENKKIIYDHLSGDIFKIANNSKCLLKNAKESRDKSFKRQILAILENDYSFAQPCSSYDGLKYIKLTKHLEWK